MSKRRRASRKPGIGRYLAVGLALGGVALAGILFVRRPVPKLSVELPDSGEAFSVPNHVGEPAPAFTAIGSDGQPYALTPGDGRPKAIVFYMGFR